VNRFDYYEELKLLARQTRAQHGLDSPRVQRSDMRRIYKFYGIKIDLWPYKLKSLRGAIIRDELGTSVMLRKDLPDDPMIFTMGHELKHFLKDGDLSYTYCHANNITEPIEIGAEVFAAELIYPEQDFIEHMNERGILRGSCTAEVIVRLKHDTKTTLSYQGLAKRADRLHFAEAGSLNRVPWKKLEQQIYGEPIYKRILRARNAEAGAHH
jgi:Zn-dependent peptidase ImmA (M78 family)